MQKKEGFVPVLKRGLLVVFLVAGMLGGCGMEMVPARQFSEASDDFAQRLRWGDYHGAAQHVDEANRSDFRQQFEALKGLHVVGVGMESVELRDDGARAVVRVAIDYYLLPSITVETFHWQQEWIRGEGEGRYSGLWQITTPFPPFP